MQLRPRQEKWVANCIAALSERGNTLGVAPTGAGKTVMLSAIASEFSSKSNGEPICFIQHRDELVGQNRRTLYQFSRSLRSDLFTADRKKWVRDGVTFAMVQTLARADNLETMPPLGLLLIDEAHHAASDSYLKIIDHARKINPDVRIGGATATPNRGDKKSLLGTFDNCADQITIKELIDTGFLVRPRTFVIDLGVREDLSRVKRTAQDFDMSEVERIMDKSVLNERIVDEWKKLAGDRRTVVFCSTVAHAQHVAATFSAGGVRAAVVEGDMASGDRKATLDAFDRGDIQVIVNVAVLTEGWDCQPVSCVILLRPSSYKSTMVQMIGRGLRKVDPERYPGIIKDDCVVIDFGTSALMHGSIEQDVDLEGNGTKVCPACDSTVPAQCKECPICGNAFPEEQVETETKLCKECGAENPLRASRCWSCGAAFKEDKEKQELRDFRLSEIDLLDMSPYRWESLFDGMVLVAAAIDAWAMVVPYNGRWYALGGSKEQGVRMLADNAERTLSIVSADDYLRETGDVSSSAKTKSWLSMPPSDKQLEMLGLTKMNSMGLTRYRASCCLTWMFNERVIRKRLENTTLRYAA